MNKYIILFTSICLSLSSCSYSQFGATASGASIGGMFGSSIGGLIGGYRGHEIGTVAGMATGAAIGMAATSQPSHNTKSNRSYNDYENDKTYVEYEEYEPVQYQNQRSYDYNEVEHLDIERIRFADANNNHYLESGECASLVMDVYNRNDYTLYDVTPQITCNNKRIQISPTAIVSELPAGKGFRYRAEVIASQKLKNGETTFYIHFLNGKKKVHKKTFQIITKE